MPRPALALRAWIALSSQRLPVVVLLMLALAATSWAGGNATAADPGPDRVEVPELRTATTKTFRHSDGRITKQLFAGPVHYSEGGDWKPIDPRLTAAAPNEQGKGFGWRMKSHRFNVLVREQLEPGHLRVDTAGRQLGLTLEGAQRRPASTRGPHVRFDEALRGVDLRYTVRPEAVKEELLLKDGSAPARYSFVLDPGEGAGLVADELPSGSWAFRARRGGRPLFVIAAPYATDAPAERSRDGAATRRQPRDQRSHVQMSVEKSGGRFAIELEVDEAWLRDDARRFPVTVDPTIVFQPSSKSAEYEAGCSTCEGFNYDAQWIGSDDYAAYRSAFQFDLSAIPPSAAVTDAKFGLWNQGATCIWTTTGACGDRSHTLNVHQMTQAWTPDYTTTGQLRWNSTASASYTLPVGAGDNWMTWDVTALAKNWISGAAPNHGVLVKRSTEPLDAGGPEVPTDTWYGDPTLRPKIEVTYASNAVRLHEPETLHGNGADLRWDRWEGEAGATFSGYEVHRAGGTGFTPSASTRVASISDLNTTTYRDTTASPSTTFTYKIVTNGEASIGRTVTLPGAGQASKVLQPDATRGQTTFIDDADGATSCANYGRDLVMNVGNDTYRERSLVNFDLRDIPAGATVASATLSTYLESSPTGSLTVGAHRVTAGWTEGTSDWGDCTGDGASWAHRSGGVPWTTPGGDYVSTAAATKSHTATDAPGWDAFDVTSIVRSWVGGGSPNHGILLRATDETVALNKSAWMSYVSDDHGQAALRPKLAVTYSDPTAGAVAPTVAIASPTAGERVRNTVTITAAASDDRRVDKVEFLVDGAVKGTDTAAPYTYAWDTKTATNGTHSLTARATDDAGNVNTSAAVSVTVANSAPPTTRVTSPSSRYDDLVKGDSPGVYWRLGEASGATTAADASGNARPGSYGGDRTGGVTGLLTGDTDRAVSLLNQLKSNSLDGRVSAGLSGLFGTALTAEAWVSYSALATNGTENRVWSRNWGTAGGWRLSVARNSAGQQVAEFAINKAGVVTTTSAVVTPGKLHLAGTYDGSTLRLYVNGAQVSSTALAAAPLNTTATVYLGQSITSTTTFDEAALYGRALTAAELRAHHDAGSGRPVAISGSHTVQAAASDDGSVTKVEFYVDGNRFGEDTTAPYSASLSTLGAEPVYDGAHTLTTRAYDDHGQVTTSADTSVTVANATGSKYVADLASTAVPQAVTYDPAAATQDKHGLDVTVTNRSQQTWSDADVVVRPRWLSPDPTAQAVLGAEVPLGAPLAPGASKTVRVLVEAPALPEGVEKAQYRLQVDLFEKSTSTFFADKGNKPLDNPVIVNKALLTGLGLEKWWHYDGEELGAGMQHLTNVANGNSLLRWTPFSAPGRGLSTVLDLTYNSLEKKSESPVGHNFNLAISGLTRFGNPIDVHPNKADEIAGRANRFVEITDGDGTTHRFIGRQAADGTVYWEEPAGVHLYLRSLPDTDARGRWAFTRPDRVTFFYDVDGYPTMIEDANGNRITYTLEATPPGEDPGGPKKRITAVTDAGGRSFGLDYYSKDEAKKAHVRGKVQRITDHTGSALDFVYYEDGNLLRIIQRGGTNADGTPLADRSFVFTYTTSNGDAAAIPAAADRADPDPRTPNQSTRLYSVRDPRGRETTFTYLGPGNGQDRWKLASRTNRADERSTYAYDTTTRVTTVTAPLSRVTRYAYDVEGKVLSIVDPGQERTALEWTGDRHVRKVIEPSGRFTEYDYDGNGYLTLERDQRGKLTTIEYDHPRVDGNDVAGKWKAGRTHEHISQLRRKVDPNGNETGADANAHDWLFEYDDRGNLRFLTDPDGGRSERFYNADGTVAWTKDENLNQTTFSRYDANGLPAEVIDAEGQVTQFGHDADGLLRWVQDPLHRDATGADERSYRSTMDYDAFHRMGRQSTPLLTAGDRGNLIWTGARFDANDNLVAEIGAHEGWDWTGSGATTTHDYDQMDRVTLTTGPDREVDPDGERTRVVYDEAGRVKRVTEPKGVDSEDVADDHTTEYRYDLLDRVVQKLRFNVEAGTLKETQKTHYCYEPGTGDLKWVVAPRANADSGSCTATSAPRFAEQYGYDEAHQLVSITDAGHGADGATRHTERRTYDANGNVRTQTDERGTVTETKYNGRDLPVEEIELLDKAAGRRLITRYEYDAAGNRKKIVSPRAVDADGAAPTDYVTSLQYDKVDRPIRVDLPKSGSEAQLFVHKRYDANGNLVAHSLPVKTDVDPGDRALGPIDARDKTTVTYFDTGWVKTENQPGTPRVRFAYTPEGWQRSRVPETSAGVERWDRQTTWEYWLDGMLRAKNERDGQPVRYTYDANNQLTLAKDTSGVDDANADALDVEVDYDGLGRPKEVRQQKINSDRWLTTRFAEYDLDDNVVERIDNREETETGIVLERGRRHRYVYDDSGWLVEQTDFGKKDAGDTDAHADDRRISTEHFETGWEKVRTVAKRPAGTDSTAGFTAVRQRTSWDYFDNGKLKALRTRNGAGELLESHDVTYEDPDGRYVNGHRTKDVFTLRGPKDDADAKCRDAANPCTTLYTYNAREQVTKEQRLRNGSDRSTTYELLPTGDVDVQTLHDGVKIDNDYVGQQLRQRKVIPTSGTTLIQKYEYDLDGNLLCAWEAADETQQRTCPEAETAGKLREKYEYDRLNRVRHAQRWKLLTGEKDDDTRYFYDALDRVVREIETHGASGSDEDRRTEFGYLGTSPNTVQETLHYTHGAKQGQTRTKTFSYDAFGNRIAMSDKPHGQTEEKEYTYGYDVHGSVSLLLDETGKAKAQYGYSPYGETDKELTRELDPAKELDPNETSKDAKPEEPFNPYQYSAKRYDSGSETLDMGARRFGPEAGRFLQQDFFEDALGNLGLATDPLTANRYALAAGNPVSFVETDGHMFRANGGGGSVTVRRTTRRSPRRSRSSSSSAGNVFQTPFWMGDNSQWEVATLNARRAEAMRDYMNQRAPNQSTLSKLLLGEVDREGDPYCPMADQCLESGMGSAAKVAVRPLLKLLGKAPKLPGSRQLLAQASRHAARTVRPNYRSFTPRNFRHNLKLRTGQNPPSHVEAHHVFPKADEFAQFFRSKGIEPNNPKFGAWWERSGHNAAAQTYNQQWRLWIQSRGANATRDDVMAWGRELSRRYGVDVGF